jgi:hypothetical protein
MQLHFLVYNMHVALAVLLLLLLPLHRSCPSLSQPRGLQCPGCSSWLAWQGRTCWWRVLSLLLRALLALRGPARAWRGWGWQVQQHSRCGQCRPLVLLVVGVGGDHVIRNYVCLGIC